jgi:hypothetical protein
MKANKLEKQQTAQIAWREGGERAVPNNLPPKKIGKRKPPKRKSRTTKAKTENRSFPAKTKQRLGHRSTTGEDRLATRIANWEKPVIAVSLLLAKVIALTALLILEISTTARIWEIEMCAYHGAKVQSSARLGSGYFG